jgi:hypothetical protein
VLLKAVEAENGDRSGVHLIRRSRKEFDEYVLSFLHGNEIKHFEIVHEDDKYGIKNGPKFENMTQLLDFYKTPQVKKNSNTKYCAIKFNNHFQNLFFSRTNSYTKHSHAFYCLLQARFPIVLTKYCPIPKDGECLKCHILDILALGRAIV